MNTMRPQTQLDLPTDSITVVQRAVLEPAGLTLASLEQALGALMSRRLDYGDLYFQKLHQESWAVEDGIVREGTHSIDQGVGVRAVSGERTGFAYSDQLDLPALLDAVEAARGIVRTGGDGRFEIAGRQPHRPPLYGADDPLASLEDTAKVRLLADLDQAVRRMDTRIVQVMASLAGVHELILVLASDGTLAADIRPLVRLNISVIMEQGARREQGYAGGGGRTDYSLFDEAYVTALAREAVRQADVNLGARPAPAGNMTVVLGSGWPGVLLHEAIGHGLEGDFNRKQTSAFSGRMGQRVATEQCTVVDDGTLPGRRGSLTVDDEGTPTGRNVLIEHGVLKAYMHDKLNARLMQTRSTGNGRRESFAHAPMPRMTNTYMLPGKYEAQEIIASVKKGLYAPNFGGGQVDITSGKFVFSASEAYLIENGRTTAAVKGAMLIGSGPEVLTHVSMVGNDLALDTGVGTCGKDGQSVPVGVGQPTLRVDALTVGGTEA